jgi:hypothetical protein
MNKSVFGTIIGAALLGTVKSKGSSNQNKYLPEDIFMRLIYGDWGPMAYLAGIQNITMDQIVEATKHHRVAGKREYIDFDTTGYKLTEEQLLIFKLIEYFSENRDASWLKVDIPVNYHDFLFSEIESGEDWFQNYIKVNNLNPDSLEDLFFDLLVEPYIYEIRIPKEDNIKLYRGTNGFLTIDQIRKEPAFWASESKLIAYNFGSTPFEENAKPFVVEYEQKEDLFLLGINPMVYIQVLQYAALPQIGGVIDIGYHTREKRYELLGYFDSLYQGKYDGWYLSNYYTLKDLHYAGTTFYAGQNTSDILISSPSKFSISGIYDSSDFAMFPYEVDEGTFIQILEMKKRGSEDYITEGIGYLSIQGDESVDWRIAWKDLKDYLDTHLGDIEYEV